MPGIILDLESQYYKDYRKVKMLERPSRAGRSGRIAVNAPPLGSDTNYDQWRPGDQVTDADAALSGRASAIWTIYAIEDDMIAFDRGLGRIDTTRRTNLVRIQERHA